MNVGQFSPGDRKTLALLSLLLAAGLFFNFFQKSRRAATPAVLLSSLELPAGYFNSTSAARPVPKILEAPLDLNRATVEELEILPGVGPATALRIAEYRQKSGGFKKIEELLKVPGIGPKKLARIKPKVEIGAPVVSSAGSVGK
jgi:competence ComEA-like helix-hairpin-helix protein